jgi:hypothetical protein
LRARERRGFAAAVASGFSAVSAGAACAAAAACAGTVFLAASFAGAAAVPAVSAAVFRPRVALLFAVFAAFLAGFFVAVFAVFLAGVRPARLRGAGGASVVLSG